MGAVGTFVDSRGRPLLQRARSSLSATDSAHAGASHSDPMLAGWSPAPGSADADLLDELGTLRPRSRDLARNNGLAAGADQTLRDNIVGSQLRLAAQPDARLLGWDRAFTRDWTRATEAQFATWANRAEEIDAGRSLTLLGLTLQALGGWFLNGEAFAIPHWLPRTGVRWNTRLQAIEADRIETPPELAHRTDIRHGIQVDRFGAPVAYYVRTPHPGDHYGSTLASPFAEHRRIVAFTRWGRRRVLHLHDKERSGQSRGKPLVTAIMRELRMASQYTRTELQATVSSSLISAFLESDLGQQGAAELYGTNDIEATSNTWRQVAQQWRPTLKGGAVIPLPPGAKISAFDPSRPNNAFEAFMLAVLRHIAAGLNMPYELLAKDFSRTNYSSARAALLEAWRYFQGRRTWLQTTWLQPLYELWLEEAVNAGVIEAPDFYRQRHAYSRASWIMSGRGWVDPSKEADAAGKRLGHHLTTLRQECAEQGLDWEEVLEQRAEEQALADQLGLRSADIPPPEPEPASPAEPAQPQQEAA